MSISSSRQSLKAALFAIPTLPHQVRWLGRLADGLRRHGVEVDWLAPGEGVERADFVACWGLSGRRQLVTERPVLIAEAGFLGKRAVDWASLGWHDIGGRADYQNAEVDSARGNLWRGQMQPCRDPEGRYLLIMGQCAGDAAWRGTDPLAWYRGAAASLRQTSALPILLRPHPLGGPVAGFDHSVGTLQEDLAGAAGVITFCSTSGVDAVMAGVPTVATDPGSMVFGLVPSAPPFTRLDESPRDRWLDRLAYCQWSAAEFVDGTAWDHIKKEL